MTNKGILRIVVAVLVIAGLFGIGAAAYQMGMAQGIASSPQVAEQLRQGVPGGFAGMPYGRGMFGQGTTGFMHGGFVGGFGPLGIGLGILGGIARFLIGLMLFLLFVRLIGWAFFGGRARMWGGPGRWGGMGRWGGPEGGSPPWFEDWHKRAHGEPPAPPAPPAAAPPAQGS